MADPVQVSTTSTGPSGIVSVTTAGASRRVDNVAVDWRFLDSERLTLRTSQVEERTLYRVVLSTAFAIGYVSGITQSASTVQVPKRFGPMGASSLIISRKVHQLIGSTVFSTAIFIAAIIVAIAEDTGRVHFANTSFWLAIASAAFAILGSSIIYLRRLT